MNNPIQIELAEPLEKQLQGMVAVRSNADGAGDGNRTRVNSLEGYRTTIVLHPLKAHTLDYKPLPSRVKAQVAA